MEQEADKPLEHLERIPVGCSQVGVHLLLTPVSNVAYKYQNTHGGHVII